MSRARGCDKEFRQVGLWAGSLFLAAVLAAIFAVRRVDACGGGGQPTTASLAVSVSPGTAGTVTPDYNPPGGTSPATPSWVETYSIGTLVALTVSPASGWHFGQWSGNLTGSANPSSVMLSADRYVTANFVPDVWFQASTSSAAESAGTVNVTVVRTSAPTGSTVSYSVGGTASGGIDHSLSAGQLIFSANETSKNIAVPIVNDSLAENNETVVITLSAMTNAYIGSPATHTLTITDDDNAPTVQFQDFVRYATESAGTVNIPVTLSAASGATVTVNYTVSGTATGGVDYTLTNDHVTFSPGETSKNIAVTILNDILDENAETIILTLSSPANASLGTPTLYVLTINDDDPPPTVQFQAATSSANENAGTVNVPVTLSAASGKVVIVHYTVSGTATGGGVDHNLAAEGMADFSAGQTISNIAVPIVNDMLHEGAETIILTLSSPVNATLGAITVHTFTIIDMEVSLAAVKFGGTEYFTLYKSGTGPWDGASETFVEDYTVPIDEAYQAATTASPEIKDPICVGGGSSGSEFTASVRLWIDDPNVGNVRIRGKVGGVVVFTTPEAGLPCGPDGYYGPMSYQGSLGGSPTDFTIGSETLTIQWEYSIPGGSFEPIGTSENPVFRVLRPGPQPSSWPQGIPTAKRVAWLVQEANGNTPARLDWIAQAIAAAINIATDFGMPNHPRINGCHQWKCLDPVEPPVYPPKKWKIDCCLGLYFATDALKMLGIEADKLAGDAYAYPSTDIVTGKPYSSDVTEAEWQSTQLHFTTSYPDCDDWSPLENTIKLNNWGDIYYFSVKPAHGPFEGMGDSPAEKDRSGRYMMMWAVKVRSDTYRQSWIKGKRDANGNLPGQAPGLPPASY